jgi:hypothetical protein
VAAYLLANPVTSSYSNANVASYLPTYSGLMANVTITGNLYVPGNVFFYNTSQLTIEDNIINLHSYANLAPLTFNDTKDIGIKFHYYDTADQHAFLGRANDTGYLEWYSNGTEAANVFTGSAYGTIKTGNLVLTNSAVIPSLTMTGLMTTRGILETANIVASSPGTSANIDVMNNVVTYWTSNSTANVTVNVRGNSTTTFNSVVANGQSLGLTLLITNGSTAYWPNVFQIDSSTVSVKWQGGTAITSGNATGIDAYNYSIIKTSINTYTVLGSQTKFA